MYLQTVSYGEGFILPSKLQQFASPIVFRAAEKYDNWFLIGAGYDIFQTENKDYFLSLVPEKVNTYFKANSILD